MHIFKVVRSAQIVVLPEMTSFLFFLIDFQSQLDSHFFFPLVSMAVLAEKMALYIGSYFSFCLDYMHVPYKNEGSQSLFTFKHRENKPPTPISNPRSTIGIAYSPSALPCCCTVSKLNLRDQSPVLQQKRSSGSTGSRCPSLSRVSL